MWKIHQPQKIENDSDIKNILSILHGDRSNQEIIDFIQDHETQKYYHWDKFRRIPIPAWLYPWRTLESNKIQKMMGGKNKTPWIHIFFSHSEFSSQKTSRNWSPYGRKSREKWSHTKMRRDQIPSFLSHGRVHCLESDRVSSHYTRSSERDDSFATITTYTRWENDFEQLSCYAIRLEK